MNALELLGQADHMTLWVGNQGKSDTGDRHRFLHDPAAEVQRVGDRVVHALDSDEEGNQVVVPLQRADRGVQRTRNSGVDQRVAGKGSLGGVGPAEQRAEERPGAIRVGGPISA